MPMLLITMLMISYHLLCPLENLNDEERKWSTCDGESTCLWQHLIWFFRLRTFIETSLPCLDGPTPRRRWRSRASWWGQTRTSTTTWRRIHCYGRFDFLLGVAWSEINLILCDAVGNDRGDDGDVRDIDDDDKRVAPPQCREEGKSGHPHPEPSEDDCHWFDHTAGLDGFLRGSGLIFFVWLSLHTWSSRGWVQHGARDGKHCHLFYFSWFDADFCFTIK